MPIDPARWHPRQPTELQPCRYEFPPAERCAAALPAVTGGDFEPPTIVAAYTAGLFPWPSAGGEYQWWSPDPRAVIPLHGLHISRRLTRTIASGRFTCTIDQAFREVMLGCAGREEGTWITPALLDGYCALHEAGWAHSVEAWTSDGELAGGVYGVQIGRMFGAESMFHRVTDESKVALAALVSHLNETGIELLDIQVITPHTASLGAIEVTRAEYLRRLRAAIR